LELYIIGLALASRQLIYFYFQLTIRNTVSDFAWVVLIIAITNLFKLILSSPGDGTAFGFNLHVNRPIVHKLNDVVCLSDLLDLAVDPVSG
jgi:hypothetical protein